MAFVLPGRHKAGVENESRTDDQLMAAWSRGKRSAFDSLYERYRQPLYGYLIRACPDESIANELFQDVWLRVISGAENFEGRNRFRSWLFALAHNRVVDLYRKAENKMVHESADNLAAADNPVDRADSDEEAARLEEAVKSLPLEQKQAFYLREEGGFAISDIAEIQDITVEAAKSRLRYAYRKLRDAMGEENE